MVTPLDREQKKAKKDQSEDEIDKLTTKKVPSLSKVVNSMAIARNQADIRSAISSKLDQSKDILIDLDEVDCPHCGGKGTKGWNGDLCVYCRGACVVSHEKMRHMTPTIWMR